MSIEAEILFNPNVNKRVSVLVRNLSCAVKDNIFTRGVKREIEIVKEFGIQ